MSNLGLVYVRILRPFQYSLARFSSEIFFLPFLRKETSCIRSSLALIAALIRLSEM